MEEIFISYTVLTHNEDESLKKLLDQLHSIMKDEDEIIIVDDFSDNPKTLEIFEDFTKRGQTRVLKRKLEGDFASQKNYADSMAKNDWIFNIDADEYLGDKLAKEHKELISLNNECELIQISRVNIVDGVTENHFRMWGWKAAVLPELTETKIFYSEMDMEYIFLKKHNFIIQEKPNGDNSMIEVLYRIPVINWDDKQFRLYRNSEKIKWINKVHEYPVGYKAFTILPDMSDYSIFHRKSVAKQQYQNDFYSYIGVKDGK